jgi:hypothetical protein
MSELKDVVTEATRLYEDNDYDALVAIVGRRELAAEKGLAASIATEEAYDFTIEGMDEAKALGLKVLGRWNRELYQLVCPTAGATDKDRQALVDSLNLGEVAVVGTVAGLILTLGVPAPVAAALAPLIVKKFVWPAKDELCDAWGKAIKEQG